MQKAKFDYKRIFIYFGIFSIVFIVCLESSFNPFSKYLPSIDSSVFITIAQGILKGKTPYVNFFDHKGPLLYLINCLGLVLNGTLGIWIIEFILMLITAIFFYKTARLFTFPVLSLISTVITFVIFSVFFDYGNLTEEYAVYLIAPSMYIFTKACYKQFELKRMQVFLLGIFFGLSLMLRPNMFGLWFGFCFVIFIETIKQKRYRLAWQYISFFLFGAVLSILPFILYLATKHALSDFITQYLFFNLQYASDSANQSSILFYFYNAYELLLNPSIWFLLCAMIVYAFILKKDNKGSYNYYYASALSIFASVALICIASTFFLHYAMVLVPLFVPAIAISCHYIYVRMLADKKNSIRIIIICLISGIIFFDAFCFGSDIVKKVISLDQKTEEMEVIRLIKENTNESDEISVIGNSCDLYFYAERGSISKYIYQRPIALFSNEIAKEYLNDLKTGMPKLIIIDINIYDSGKKEEIKFYSDIVKILDKEYNNIHDNLDDYIIFIRNG